MAHLVDHAADRRRIGQLARPVPLVEPEADQRRALVLRTPDRAADLGDADGLAGRRGLCCFLAIGGYSRAAAAAASPSRRPNRSLTFLPRFAATARGLDISVRAANVALIMLCGLLEPIDLATMSWSPRVSNTARIGPPAMMPVPGLAERTTTLPEPKRPLAVVVQCAALAQRDADHAALGLLGGLADRLGHFARLARAVAGPALAVADDDDRGEAEPPAALHHLGDAVDADELLDQLDSRDRPDRRGRRAAARPVPPPCARAITIFPCDFVRSTDDQNDRPPSRAPSASAFTRP